MKVCDSTCQQSDKKATKQIRIDSGLHCLLKMKAAKQGVTVKSLLEDYLADILAVDGGDNNDQ